MITETCTLLGKHYKHALTLTPVSKWVKILLPFHLLIILLTFFQPCHRFFQPSVFCRAFSPPMLLPLWLSPDKTSSFFLNFIPWAKKRCLLLASYTGLPFPLAHEKNPLLALTSKRRSGDYYRQIIWICTKNTNPLLQICSSALNIAIFIIFKIK